MTSTRRPAARKQRGRLGYLLLGRPPKKPRQDHHYRCGVCRTSYGPAPSREAARAIRDWHRGDRHGGGAPDGEKIISPPPPDPFDWLRGYQPAFVRCAVALGVVLVLFLTFAQR
ncbi:hypothetical protein ACFY0G_02140 [Streptomyces sp. NPDC001552]|uniref:hypothetical protein n=1 Tax=Streptomyces sp. NPDC001552 TaxID=3364587 RepID=UPI0036C08268